MLILVVEDEALIALPLVLDFVREGHNVPGPAATAEDETRMAYHDVSENDLHAFVDGRRRSGVGRRLGFSGWLSLGPRTLQQTSARATLPR
jgi:hypothetical protein